MFNFMTQDQGQDQNDTGRDLGGRIMAAQYNLAVQRRDRQWADQSLAVMLGQWLSTRSGR